MPEMRACFSCDRAAAPTSARRQAHVRVPQVCSIEAHNHPMNYEHVWDCSVCEAAFVDDEDMVRHERARHTTECKLCHKQFCNKNPEQSLLNHTRSKAHTTKCEYCNIELVAADPDSALKQHISTTHAACKFCDKVFNGLHRSQLVHQHTVDAHFAQCPRLRQGVLVLRPSEGTATTPRERAPGRALRFLSPVVRRRGLAASHHSRALRRVQLL